MTRVSDETVRKFNEIRRHVSAIHAAKGVQFKASATDERYQRPYSVGPDYIRNYIDGKGTRDDPYRYTSAASVSPHHGLIDIWLSCREQVGSRIDVNGYTFTVTHEGVTAADGVFTRLE